MHKRFKGALLLLTQRVAHSHELENPPHSLPPDRINLSSILRTIHGNAVGLIAIFSGQRPPGGGALLKPATVYVAYPDNVDSVSDVVRKEVERGREVYWCAHLLTKEQRTKSNATPLTSLYADIDHADIPFDVPQPTVAIESSPGRLQAYWRLERSIDANTGEALNKRLAKMLGADKSGYDLTQLLRIPGTPNRKYDGNPIVRVVSHTPGLHYSAERLDAQLPQMPATSKTNTPAFHHETPKLTVDEETILRRARVTANFRSWETPDDSEDRSAVDQSFCNALVSAGANREQVDAIFRKSPRMRPKWNEVHYADGRTYGQATVDTAFNGAIADRFNRPSIRAHGQSIGERAVGSDEITHWKNRALEAEAKVDHLALELAELRIENTTIVSITTNPEFKGAAPVLIRTAIAVREARRRGGGGVDENGFVRIRTTNISEDFDQPFDGLQPICSRSTVGRHLKKAAEFGLIEREVRSVMAPRLVRDAGHTPIIDPETRQPKTIERRTDQTWVKFTGESLADMLRPFAFFRAPEPTETLAAPKPTRHGGDRRSAAFEATRTPCPDCGSIERKTFCVGCGCDVSDVAEADEQRAYEAARTAQTIPASTTFQDAPYKSRGVDTAFHLETSYGFKRVIHSLEEEKEQDRTTHHGGQAGGVVIERRGEPLECGGA